MTAADVLRAELSAPPRPPVDPDRFSSNALFGEPGIYPQGTLMVPASGGPPNEPTAIAALDRYTEALRRGNACTTDVMGSVHIFAHKNDPLDAVREQFGVVPIRPGV